MPRIVAIRWLARREKRRRDRALSDRPARALKWLASYKSAMNTIWIEVLYFGYDITGETGVLFVLGDSEGRSRFGLGNEVQELELQ